MNAAFEPDFFGVGNHDVGPPGHNLFENRPVIGMKDHFGIGDVLAHKELVGSTWIDDDPDPCPVNLFQRGQPGGIAATNNGRFTTYRIRSRKKTDPLPGKLLGNAAHGDVELVGLQIGQQGGPGGGHQLQGDAKRFSEVLGQLDVNAGVSPIRIAVAVRFVVTGGAHPQFLPGKDAVQPVYRHCGAAGGQNQQNHEGKSKKHTFLQHSTIG